MNAIIHRVARSQDPLAVLASRPIQRRIRLPVYAHVTEKQEDRHFYLQTAAGTTQHFSFYDTIAQAEHDARVTARACGAVGLWRYTAKGLKPITL